MKRCWVSCLVFGLSVNWSHICWSRRLIGRYRKVLCLHIFWISIYRSLFGVRGKTVLIFHLYKKIKQEKVLIFHNLTCCIRMCQQSSLGKILSIGRLFYQLSFCWSCISRTGNERYCIVSVSDLHLLWSSAGISDKKVYYHGYASLFHLDRYILLFVQVNAISALFTKDCSFKAAISLHLIYGLKCW